MVNLSIICAMSKVNLGIGFQNKLAWVHSLDLKKFKSMTMGKTLLMGRNTYESLPVKLSGRKIIILTSDPKYSPAPKADQVTIATSFDQAFDKLSQWQETDLMIAGGAQIYRQALEHYQINSLYLTMIEGFNGALDTFFPQVDFSRYHLESRYDLGICPKSGLRATFFEYVLI